LLDKILKYSIEHKFVVLLFSAFIVGFGGYSLSHLPFGAVPDVTNNQVQIITTTRNLATEDVEKFITYPVELEMANLPGVIEIRSVSKFGLSVVTVVFEDDMGTYLPRQLIEEKLKSAEEKIPKGFGSPFLGPISTGLGEIYQYIIDVDSAYQDHYSLTDIRTIQDWIVKRQLSGIPGVVEVNTWGGFLKQYEVAVSPEKLRSLEISISEVFSALENSNSVAGGGYIEKEYQSYFIRGEGLLSSLKEIENVVIATRNGVPLFVKDVAKVGFGKAIRFGAITANGKGEKVMGQVMMLKGANSSQVIKEVKERVAIISESLPPGIHINPILERSELISNTTFTIAENLILGCLIVIFVVVLLLGNLRSGLVVASVIPMTLLFALSLMYVFDVDANLMSLGAIDFGIIIDGAVIIVEYISFRMTSKKEEYLAIPLSDRQKFSDKIAFKGSSKMMHSAIFGQLIIIIVFIPILSFVGIEGKMFRPMGLVFTFALLGAILLCLTYVPVMSALFIRPEAQTKETFSSKLIFFLSELYQPSLQWAMEHKKLILTMAVGVFVASMAIFSKMGGEFIPTLDEGDFVIQPVLKTGTSLGKTVEITTQIEQLLLQFPEVKQISSRIGAAEVPTDPMSMEESDIIIKLHPKSEWVSAKSKDELAGKFKELLVSQIPGVEFEFTQPIEMRFNELITGVRTDIAIKVFGDDLETLHHVALEVQEAIQNVDGAADIIVEKTEGLPQMVVKYNRMKLAKYGLHVEELNNVLLTGFAGATAGTIFEGEKQFELVLRFDERSRQSIHDLEQTTISMPNGGYLPFKEFAEISYTKGPAKISRDNTKRRIVIGVNVRNRDLESVVNDVKQRISEKVVLPTGYYAEYGGQFENLENAKNRLYVVVPIALILIFILLFFAFDSVKEALIIYSAIPLSAVGGILALYFRGLPFSISAGVGFIALFGIAVLNGIVLIEEFKELKSQGMMNIHERILTGTRKRLRPVLLTAIAAALGFLPMAISTSAGAEVQRPLATVVIGGLISATFLTLIVLPVLYSMFDREKPLTRKFRKPITILIGILFLGSPIFSQDVVITLEQAIQIALTNNRQVRTSELQIDAAKNLQGAGYTIDKTELYYQFDENNIAPNDMPLRVFGVSQQFEFPTIYGARKQVLKSATNLAADRLELTQRLVAKEVSKSYYETLYLHRLAEIYVYLDSLYTDFEKVSTKRYEAGESSILQKLSAEQKHQEIRVNLDQTNERIRKSLVIFNRWMQSDTFYVIPHIPMDVLVIQPIDTMAHPGLRYFSDAIIKSQQELKVAKQGLLPDITVNVFNGWNDGMGQTSFLGYQAGIAIPLFYGADKAKIDAAKTNQTIQQSEAENYKIRLEAQLESLLADIAFYDKEIQYYENTGRNLSRQIILQSRNALDMGEINFLQFVGLLERAEDFEINFQKALLNYNRTVLEINYLMNE
jgi:cobalt-zinc-cadmium resistance protein CzcA